MIWSEEAMKEQGIPKAFWEKSVGNASQPLNFDTGNGPVAADKSFVAISPAIGKQEAYKLKLSPNASSMGCVVEEADQPLFWTKGIRPWYCSDKSKLT